MQFLQQSWRSFQACQPKPHMNRRQLAGTGVRGFLWPCRANALVASHFAFKMRHDQTTNTCFHSQMLRIRARGKLQSHQPPKDRSRGCSTFCPTSSSYAPMPARPSLHLLAQSGPTVIANLTAKTSRCHHQSSMSSSGAFGLFSKLRAPSGHRIY